MVVLRLRSNHLRPVVINKKAVPTQSAASSLNWTFKETKLSPRCYHQTLANIVSEAEVKITGRWTSASCKAAKRMEARTHSHDTWSVASIASVRIKVMQLSWRAVLNLLLMDKLKMATLPWINSLQVIAHNTRWPSNKLKVSHSSAMEVCSTFRRPLISRIMVKIQNHSQWS